MTTDSKETLHSEQDQYQLPARKPVLPMLFGHQWRQKAYTIASQNSPLEEQINKIDRQRKNKLLF
jgi:hypothetical protein